MLDPEARARAVDEVHPRRRADSVAHVLSMLASPPAMALAAAILTAIHVGGSGAMLWAGSFAMLSVGVPVLYLMHLLREGRVDDIEVVQREQRGRPYLLAAFCTVLSYTVLRIGGAPAELVGLAGVIALQTLLISLINAFWKISLHCAMATQAGMVAWMSLGTPLVALILSPSMIWARVRLHRHTLLQTLAGTALAALLHRFAHGLMAGS